MTKLVNYQSAQTTKMLFIGNNGSGKTGALAALADAGYNLRIIDTDNGGDVLVNMLTDASSRYGKDSHTRVDIETLTDPMRLVGTKLVPGKATVWQRAVGLLTSWKTPDTDFGAITTWSTQDVLVIDSLTTLSNAAMNFILSMNARLGQQPHQSDWYQGQQLIESMIQMLFDVSVKCNVIINCHIKYIGEENGPQQGYPDTLGKALSPKLGSYFNTILMAKTVGKTRKIFTNTAGMVELKNTAPLRVQAEYPIETGLADYFKAVRAEPSLAPKIVPTVPVAAIGDKPSPVATKPAG